MTQEIRQKSTTTAGPAALKFVRSINELQKSRGSLVIF